jgi:hypothetical protein
MSEFVDLMLDGVICQRCGQFLGDATGFPRSCEGCERLDASEYAELNESALQIPESTTSPEEFDDDLPF